MQKCTEASKMQNLDPMAELAMSVLYIQSTASYK